jgi:hypothetical protein
LRDDETIAATSENRRLTFFSIYDFFPISRPVEGAFHERRETRGGERWPLGAKDVSHLAEAQAAMIRVQYLGSPAEDTKLAAPARASLLRGCRRASLKHRARNAGVFSAVRGATNLMRFHTLRMGPRAG